MPERLDVDALGAWLLRFADAVASNETLLTDLDSPIGDADHGANMRRGMTAAAEVVRAGGQGSVKELFAKVGMTLVSKVGGASGPLYGTFFLRFGAAAGASTSLDAAGFGRGLRAGLTGLAQRGKCVAEDKTMFDALAPACAAYDEAVAHGADLATALAAAAAAAEAGRDATIGWVARKGRASYLGERSAGHQDPGATSAALLIRAAADVAREA